MAQSEGEVRELAVEIQGRLSDLAAYIRQNMEDVDDPKAEALFETTAEVLDGLAKAYAHYEERSEKAWQ